MKLISLAAPIFAVALVAIADWQTEELRYSPKYTQNLPSHHLACRSDLSAHGWATLGAVPGFPDVGGITTQNGSPACGACYNVSYPSTGKWLNISIVDNNSGSGATGFVVSLDAMNYLDDDDAEDDGVITVNAMLLSSTGYCQPSQ